MSNWKSGDVIVHIPTGDLKTLGPRKRTKRNPGWCLTDGGELTDEAIADDEWRLVSDLCADYLNLSKIFESPNVKDLELKIRDGEVTVRSLLGDDTGGTASQRFLAALMLNFLLGDTNEMPANYRSFELSVRPAGSREYRFYGEVIQPEGRTSHQIREELEAICVMFADGNPRARAAFDAYQARTKAASRAALANTGKQQQQHSSA